MFTTKSKLIAAAVANAVLMNEATDGTSGSAGGAAPRKRGPKVNLLDIQRGRIPLALVAAIRFQEPADKSNKELANKYGTSVGKVFDIRKGRNFGYVTESYKPSQDDIKAAEAWAKGAAQHGGDEAAIMAMVDKLGVATEEEAKAQAATITAARSKGPRQPKGEKPAAGGEGSGNATDLLK